MCNIIKPFKYKYVLIINNLRERSMIILYKFETVVSSIDTIYFMLH